MSSEQNIFEAVIYLVMGEEKNKTRKNCPKSPVVFSPLCYFFAVRILFVLHSVLKLQIRILEVILPG